MKLRKLTFVFLTVSVLLGGRAAAQSASSMPIYPGQSLVPSMAYDKHAGKLDPRLDSLGTPEVIEAFRNVKVKTSNPDPDFDYYQIGSGLYRHFKKPKPVMSYADRRPIPHAPALFWPGVLEFVSDDTGPARPNCSEAKFGVEDYKAILNDPSVRTKADFLEKLPKDVLQKFTFITKSESLQRHGVSELTPRVMRFSTDGKMILAYTTNPESKNHSSVEVMFFNDKTRSYEFINTSFVQEKDILDTSKKPRTSVNSPSCFACHGGLDPRPNWRGYADWPGTFGQNDDMLTGASVSQSKSYAAMRAHLAGTPELETLPWPSKTSSLYEQFPYTLVSKDQTYNLRPNAHFTIVSSRLNAVRLSRKFEESPVFPKVKWSLLYRALECPNPTAHSNPVLDGLISKSSDEYSGLATLPEWRYTPDRASNLYKAGTAFGFLNTDWSLDFEKSPGKKRISAYNTAQWEMSEFLLSVLFRNLAKEEPELQKYDARINRMSALFGEKFMCVDEIADKLWRGEETYQASCAIVGRKAKEEIASLTSSDLTAVAKVETVNWPQRTWSGFGLFASSEHGEKIVRTTCAYCHDGSALSANFKTLDFLKHPALSIEAKRARLDRIQEKLGTPEKCEMPMPVAGPCLTNYERNSVMKYLESI